MEQPEGSDTAENALLARVGRGDAGAFESAYDRYAGAVYSLAVKTLRDPRVAEEVTQDVFLAIWRSARDFDPERGRARSWILSLAHHKTVDALRRQRVRAVEPLSDAIAVESDVAAEGLRAVVGAGVRNALDGLAEKQREVIVLAYYGGYTQQEIARRLGVPLGTVKTRMRDGMQRLREALAPGMEETPS